MVGDCGEFGNIHCIDYLPSLVVMKRRAAHAYWVYIVRCSDGTLYTGIAKDLEKRIHEHNTATTGAKYTKARRPVVCVYRTRATDRADAQSKEVVIKRLSRVEKEALIEENLVSLN